MAEAATITDRNHNSLKGQVSETEWQTRVDLAAGCRIAYKFGWNKSIRNHFVARVPDEPDHILINPRGLLWCELTASDFIKFDFDGNQLTESELPPGPAGLNFHSALLRLKPDRGASLHIHEDSSVAVSASIGGLKFINQESLALYGQIAYHDYEGLAQAEEEGPLIAEELGEKNCMIMRNHGLLTIARSIAETFAIMDRLVDTCRVQTKLMMGGAEFQEVPKEVCENTYEQYKKRWKARPLGQDEWAAFVRQADRDDPSFRL
jgi:ribulose-5-phosphate 4-epimerase/fuculose-1-phosphate aldolase